MMIRPSPRFVGELLAIDEADMIEQLNAMIDASEDPLEQGVLRLMKECVPGFLRGLRTETARGTHGYDLVELLGSFLFSLLTTAVAEISTPDPRSVSTVRRVILMLMLSAHTQRSPR